MIFSLRFLNFDNQIKSWSSPNNILEKGRKKAESFKFQSLIFLDLKSSLYIQLSKFSIYIPVERGKRYGLFWVVHTTKSMITLRPIGSWGQTSTFCLGIFLWKNMYLIRSKNDFLSILFWGGTTKNCHFFYVAPKGSYAAFRN